ncbi:AzlC family ABC transporter permease, partial [Mucilaginibacter sp. 5C4]
MPHPTPLASFTAGARDTIPMLLGAAPFGMIFGALVATAQMHAWQGQLMSLAVFAGSSQFIAVGLIASHTGFLVIWLATFI